MAQFLISKRVPIAMVKCSKCSKPTLSIYMLHKMAIQWLKEHASYLEVSLLHIACMLIHKLNKILTQRKSASKHAKSMQHVTVPTFRSAPTIVWFQDKQAYTPETANKTCIVMQRTHSFQQTKIRIQHAWIMYGIQWTCPWEAHNRHNPSYTQNLPPSVNLHGIHRSKPCTLTFLSKITNMCILKALVEKRFSSRESNLRWHTLQLDLVVFASVV